MEYQVDSTDSLLTLRLDGDLISVEINEEIIQQVEKYIETGMTMGIVNIEKVNYINSIGISVLVTMLTKFRNRGGDLVLVNPSEHVKKLFIITKLENIFNIAASETEALQILEK